MKKKAFTLTELLVVVVIIGVLSAIVLPKFSKVLETRKTTEAEAMLMAVRGEQEARCTLDKPYVQEAHKDQLASLPSNTGNNYTYTLTGSGVTASSQDKDYELSIKSYEDGRICCSGTYCASLNKKYPSCDELPADNSGCGVADVGTSTNPCAGGDCEPEAPAKCTEYSEGEIANQTPGECGGYLYQRRHCDAETGVWSTYEDDQRTACEEPEPPACDGSHTEGETFYKEECECGKATYAWHCGEDTNYTWQEKLTTPCVAKPEDEEESCGNVSNGGRFTGKKTRSYSCEAGQWKPGDWDTSNCVCDTRSAYADYCIDDANGTLDEETCECNCPDGLVPDDTYACCKIKGRRTSITMVNPHTGEERPSNACLDCVTGDNGEKTLWYYEQYGSNYEPGGIRCEPGYYGTHTGNTAWDSLPDCKVSSPTLCLQSSQEINNVYNELDDCSTLFDGTPRNTEKSCRLIMTTKDEFSGSWVVGVTYYKVTCQFGSECEPW